MLCRRCADQIAVPEFRAGAMENWGLVTYRETNLLFSEHVSSPVDKQRIATVVAHELAHMVTHRFHYLFRCSYMQIIDINLVYILLFITC